MKKIKNDKLIKGINNGNKTIKIQRWHDCIVTKIYRKSLELIIKTLKADRYKVN